MNDSLSHLNNALKQFAEERDWEKFHDPKNLSMALIAEAAELVEHFQWLTPEQSMNLSTEKLTEVGYEMAEFDSMAVMGVITEMEERYGIELEDDELDGDLFSTVGSLQDFINYRLSIQE